MVPSSKRNTAILENTLRGHTGEVTNICFLLICEHLLLNNLLWCLHVFRFHVRTEGI